MPFLDGFAQAFTGMYNATSSRRSERERTELGHETLEETRRSHQADEEVARGALDVDRGRLGVEQSADAREGAKWEEEKKYLPGKADALAAEAELNRANAASAAQDAVAKRWANSPEGRAATERKLASDIDFQSAQSENQRATARANAASAAIDEWKMSDEGKQISRDAAAAAIRLSDANAAQATGAGAASAATARSTDLDTTIKQSGPGLRATINAQQLLKNYFPGLSLEDAAKYGETGELPTRAIPEGETAPEPDSATTTGYSRAERVAPVGAPAPEASPPPEQAIPVPGQEIAAGAPPEPTGPASPAIAAAQRGAAAGPAVRPGEIPYTAGTAADPPAPSGPLSNTYRADAEVEMPYRPNEPFLPTPERPIPADERRDNIMGVEKISYQDEEHAGARIDKPNIGGGQGNVIEAQGGTRRLPLNDRTRTMLEQASAATGYDVRVTSGAQPSSGPNRTGSHRHDVNVGSGDVQLIDRATGKPVSMATEEGQQAIIEFMRAARDAGATGFGAGPDYMGNTTIHVGFGSPSVWGAGGKAANAPKWLVQGMSGGSGDRPSAIPEGTGVQPGVQGEKVASEAIEGKRMPTPRGEVKSNINRTLLVQNAVVAAKEGAKFSVQQAGFSGPAPAITDAGRTARTRDYLTGSGAASPKSLASAQEAIQQALPPGAAPSLSEMNLLTLASAYDWYTNVEGDPDKAKAVAGEIYQAYRQKATQYAAIAKVTAQNGDLDKAAQIMAKAYAYIPDGNEAKFTKDKDGNFLVEITDVATGKSKMHQIVPPDQLFAGIMGWSSVDFDKAILRKAGETVPTNEFETHSAQTAQAIPEAPPGTPAGTQPLTARGEMEGYAPVGGESPAIPDAAQMTKEEMGPALDLTKFATTQRNEVRERAFGKPFTTEEQGKIDEDIEAVAQQLPKAMESIATLFPGRPERINGVVHAIKQMNPNLDVQSIIGELGVMAESANNFRVVGQTSETRSTQVPDGPVLNMPTQTFTTIWNGLMRKSPPGAPAAVVAPNAVRNADTAAEGVAAEIATSGSRPSAVPPPAAPTYTDPRAPGIPTQYPPERTRPSQGIEVFGDRYGRRRAR